ncbi:unnamed protein product [Schistosoma mattheei]|uniref:N-acetylgalactosaminide beta-1,3-galactosyltransferase n=2 Tax=Schistosoma mattheei TaxID=31246 RepID=A0AA85BUI5_9TREM|nr:unnamed protein product [Schistosoma mattheei]
MKGVFNDSYCFIQEFQVFMQLSPFFRMLLIYTIGMFGGGLIVHFYYVQHEEDLYTATLFAAKSPKLTANDNAYKQLILSNDSIHEHALQHLAEATLANVLAKQVRVFCWILTMPANHKSKAVHVKATWAGRCNNYLFISSETDSHLPSIAVINTEGRNLLWNKTAGAIKYMAKHYANDYDYFMKADDDSYVIVENLRKILHKENPDKPFIMGRRFKPFVKQGYMSGGGGYVLSRAGLLNIANGLENNAVCQSNKYAFAEDVKLGSCAEATNVSVIDSLDAEGRECFHPFSPSHMLTKDTNGYPEWYLKYNYHRIDTGFDCCSDYAVSFHYIRPEEMYLYEYMLYHLHPYGIHRDYMDLMSYLQQNRIS